VTRSGSSIWAARRFSTSGSLRYQVTHNLESQKLSEPPACSSQKLGLATW